MVAKASDFVPPHSQHLCLSFDLSDVPVYWDLEEIESEMTSQFSFVLRMFLIKHAKELRLSEPQNYLKDGNLAQKFAQVFVSVLAFP